MTILRNRDREDIIREFANLYRPSDADDMVKHMPSEKDDEDTKDFQEYFGMLQTITAAPMDKSMSPSDKKELEGRMKLLAMKYGYPKKIILEVSNDRTTE